MVSTYPSKHVIQTARHWSASGSGSHLDPLVTTHEAVEPGVRDGVGVIAHDFGRDAEDHFKDVATAVACGKERVRVGIRNPAAIANDQCCESMQRFELGVGNFGAVAQRIDDGWLHLQFC